MKNSKLTECLLLVFLLFQYISLEKLAGGNSRILNYISLLICFYFFVKKNKLPNLPATGVLLVLFSTLACLYWLLSTDPDYTFVFNSVLYPLVPIIIYATTRFININYDINSSIRRFTTVALLFFMFEAGVRYTVPEYFVYDPELSGKIISKTADGLSADIFYYYKYGSFMYFDSNYVGVVLLMVLFVLLFHGAAKIDDFRLLKIVFAVILILLTLSRTAIIASLVLVLYYVITSGGAIRKVVSMLIVPAIVFYALLFAWPEIQSDDSFQGKLVIFSKIVDTALNVPVLQLLLGLGFRDGSYVYSYEEGMFAHAMIPLLLGQVGVIGLFLYISLVVETAVNNKNGFLVWILCFVVGFSLINPWAGYIFCTLALFGQGDSRKARLMQYERRDA